MPLYRWLGGDEATLLPVPMMNVLNGGAHADNPVDFQEFMIAPVGAGSFAQAVAMGAEVYQQLKRTLKAQGLATGVGDEGGFAPALTSNEEPMSCSSRPSKPPATGPARTSPSAWTRPRASSSTTVATSWPAKGRSLSSQEMVDYWETVNERYPLLFLEDGMAEQDWDGWKLLTDRLGDGLQLVGDDIFVTNPAILREGIDRGIANSILIKLNQIGTLTETLDTIQMARDAGYRCVISHRSGETEDTFIADLVVATGVGQIKTGAPARAPSASRSTTSCFVSRKNSADALASPASRPRRAEKWGQTGPDAVDLSNALRPRGLWTAFGAQGR